MGALEGCSNAAAVAVGLGGPERLHSHSVPLQTAVLPQNISELGRVPSATQGEAWCGSLITGTSMVLNICKAMFKGRTAG